MNETVVIIALLAGLVSLQYWRGRRLNLSLIRALAAELEKALEPLDKEYTWIGGYVGVIGKYKIEHSAISAVEATVSLVPRHSLLYLPISLLMGRRDRVYFLLRAQDKLPGGAHLKTGRRAKLEQEGLNYDEKKLGGTVSKRWYKDKNEIEKLFRPLAKLERPQQIKHVAVNAEENAYYAEAEITHGTAVEYLKNLLQELDKRA
ncbi:MAG TPA: hypothetical protein GX528_00440 [Firmicutes bacterium]|nr:hypothetical protein [Bacillota bacterium]